MYCLCIIGVLGTRIVVFGGGLYFLHCNQNTEASEVSEAFIPAKKGKLCFDFVFLFLLNSCKSPFFCGLDVNRFSTLGSIILTT